MGTARAVVHDAGALVAKVRHDVRDLGAAGVDADREAVEDREDVRADRGVCGAQIIIV
jgi:hypothetical protein